MCYYVDNNLTKKKLEESFKVKAAFEPEKTGGSFANGFSHPDCAIITDENPGEAVLGNWGLIPFWAKDTAIQNSTLNAKIETVESKPSFWQSVHRRCLIPVNGFYEWQWLDAKGKHKERFYIKLKNGGEPFALGGLYSTWKNPENDQEILTFTIITTQANELMAEIHNTKHRMPLVLDEAARRLWLQDKAVEHFAFPNLDPKLEAMAENLTLFPSEGKNSD